MIPGKNPTCFSRGRTSRSFLDRFRDNKDAFVVLNDDESRTFSISVLKKIRSKDGLINSLDREQSSALRMHQGNKNIYKENEFVAGTGVRRGFSGRYKVWITPDGKVEDVDTEHGNFVYANPDKFDIDEEDTFDDPIMGTIKNALLGVAKGAIRVTEQDGDSIGLSMTPEFVTDQAFRRSQDFIEDARFEISEVVIDFLDKDEFDLEETIQTTPNNYISATSPDTIDQAQPSSALRFHQGSKNINEGRITAGEFILPDGELVNIGDTTHEEFVMDNRELFNIEGKPPKHLDKALDNGAIRLNTGVSNILNINFSEPTRDAFSTLKDVLNDRVSVEQVFIEDLKNGNGGMYRRRNIAKVRNIDALRNKASQNQSSVQMFRDSMKGKLDELKSVVESIRRGWWILPDGQVEKLDESQSHIRFIDQNPEKFGFNSDEIKEDIDAKNAGAIAIRQSGRNRFNFGFSDEASNEAIRSLSSFVRDRLTEGDRVFLLKFEGEFVKEEQVIRNIKPLKRMNGVGDLLSIFNRGSDPAMDFR